MYGKAPIALRVGPLAFYLLCLIGCGGGGGEPGPSPAGMRVDGVWATAFDYGNGLVAYQNWTLTQSGSDLSITADRPDPYGPLPGAAPVGGYVAGNGLFASWVKTADSCQFYSRMETTVSFNNFSGILYWGRNAYGAGYCPEASGRISVRGVR